GEALRADRRLALAVRVGGVDRTGRLALNGGRDLRRVRVALHHEPHALVRLLNQLRRIEDAGAVAQPEDPRDDLARVRVLGLEHHAVVPAARFTRDRARV